jgi:hypothetical protein
MIRLRNTALAAAAMIAAASLITVTTAAPASAEITGRAYGTGPTLQAAESAALVVLDENYFGCGPYGVLAEGDTDGTWYARIEAGCEGAN